MAITYIKMDEDTWIAYDSETKKSTTLIKSDLRALLTFNETRLAEIPTDISDAMLLAWARENYVGFDYSAERADLVAKIEDITAILRNLV